MRRQLTCTPLEERCVPASLTLSGTELTIQADGSGDLLGVSQEAGQVIVRSRGEVVGRFASGALTKLTILANDETVAKVSADVTVPTTLVGGTGRSKLRGGGGPNVLRGNPGEELLVGGTGLNTFDTAFAPGGGDKVYRVRPEDTLTLGGGSQALRDQREVNTTSGQLGLFQETLTASEVDALLKRAAAASRTSDAIIAITDRNGRILGVRVEGGVAPEITGNNAMLVFAIDGAVALARTGAFFGNNQAPLTSRTIQALSQTTMTEREINSNPNITDPNSPLRGPGYVADVGIKGHFPPGVVNTPQVDLFGIEHTNRDGTYSVGADRIKGTADDSKRDHRFNIDGEFLVTTGDGISVNLTTPDSYGFESGKLFGGQGRGIGTLPGGIPIYKNGQVVGGIGVFFPGKTGYATESNSSTSSTFDPTKPDRALEAEYIAFAAVGGFTGSIGTLGGVALPKGINLPLKPTDRIDLVGINLDIVGPQGGPRGAEIMAGVAAAVGEGNANDGANQVIDPDANNDLVQNDPVLLRDGKAVAEGWLVKPHDGVGISSADVEQIIQAGIDQAFLTRAAIRLPLGSRTRMVFAVTDATGEVLGLYRMADATIFSIDVAVAKARNVNYYADATKIQAVDQLPNVPLGTAFTNRTFRYLALPRFPESFDLNSVPGPFSQLNDPGTNPLTARNTGGAVPANAFQSVYGYDSFNPGTNFRDRSTDIKNQNGIVFFPGSAPLYKNGKLVGGFGVSGDGVDQDDVVTGGGQEQYQVPKGTLRADQVTVSGVRLPYQKHNRNPEG
ncbi:MAG: heme-binding protein [Gemmataceae bacterium]